MRVLMVTHTYPKFPGDVTAPFVESIASALAKRGHEIEVVVPFNPELQPRHANGVVVSPFRYAPARASRWGYGGALEGGRRVRPSMYALAPAVTIALRRTVKKRIAAGSFDVLHVHWAVPSGAVLADCAGPLPMVLSVHGSDIPFGERTRVGRALVGRALRSAARVTGSSDDLVRRAVALGADPSSAMAIPYGVDVDFFSPDRPIDRAAVRKKLGAPDDAFLIVAVGRLIEVKGFEYLIEAARLTPGVHVAIAGDGDLRDQLEERIRSTAAPVRLVGPLDRDAVATVFVAADAIAVPSIVDSHGNVDGLPNTLLEALASGRPVVATRVGGIPEVINDGTNGVLVPEKDAGALAAALRRLAEDSSPRAQLGLAGRATVAERFSWQETARAFEEAYDLAAA